MDPLSALGAVSGAMGIASFGLRLATTLQTYIASTVDSPQRLKNCVSDIGSTASALQQLQDLLTADGVQDADGGSGDAANNQQLFSVEGKREVERLGDRCKEVYERIVEMLSTASQRGTRAREKGKVAKKREFNIPGKDKDEAVFGIELSMLDHIKWPWVEPRIERCREELERLMTKLLLMLLIIGLARLARLGTM